MERKPDWLPGFPVQIYCNSDVKNDLHITLTFEGEKGYAYMQAIGIVNDHVKGCHLYANK